MSDRAPVLAFAPHSGWAAVVAVGGDVERPVVVARDRVEMADTRLAGSKQPYHAVEKLPLEEGCRRCGLGVVRVRQRDLADRAAAALRSAPARLAATVQALGKPLGAPWGADQESAALFAWMLLAETR